MNKGDKTSNSLFGLSRVCNVVLRASVFMVVMMVFPMISSAHTYYSLHNKDKGYLKQCKGVVANDGTFQYADPYGSSGSSIWVYTNDHYLQCEMYYLNVANGSTLYLSTTKETQWELVDGDEFRKHFQMVGSNKILGLDGSNKPVLDASPSKKYAACTLTVTENSWPSNPTGLSFTVQSPQLVTYLRTYYKRKITVKIDKNDLGNTNVQMANNKESYVYCSLTFKPGTYGQGTNWDFNTTDGVIYNRTNSDVTAKAHYDILPLNPIVSATHPAVDKEISIKITPNAFIPDPSKKYLLFNTDHNDYRFPKDNDETLSVDDNLLVNGKNSDLTEEATDSYVSWAAECDDEGFVSFKNVKTGRYFYFDATDYTTSVYGALKVGSETLPDDDTKYKYKFRLFSGNVTRSPFGTCCYIIPYEKQFAVYTSTATIEELFFALYPNRSTNPKIASLTKASEIAKWKIYAYEWENRLWDNFSINGTGGVYETGNYDYTATTWFSRNIIGTPANAEYCMLPGSKTHEGISYIWTLTGLGSYVTTSDGGVNGSGVSTMHASVNSLPPTIITGTVKVKAQKTPTGETQPLSQEKTLYLTLYNRNPVLTDITQLSQIENGNGAYRLTADNIYNVTTNHPSVSTFNGILTVATKDDGTFYTISGLSQPLFTTATNAIISNIMLKEVDIDVAGDVGAIACTANGATRIYNCGILPTSPTDIEANPSTVASSDNKNCGSLVGKLDGTARVINCFSYAHITKGGSSGYYVSGLVGNNSKSSSQTTINTVVVNCMFYGDIDAAYCANYAPVYGNKPINNDSDTGINPYDFFREDASFDNNYTTSIDQYVRTWPVKEEYLTRYEYYRSIFNSNRCLCTWWVDGINGTSPTDADVARVGIAKWVLDPSIAPYPILKKWGKYPSIINPDPDKVWDTATGAWVQRANAAPYKGKSHGTLSVTVKPGNRASAAVTNAYGTTGITKMLTITDMDTIHYDYGYYKVQLPYYNELFGNQESNDHTVRYGGNYTDSVVTGWRITSVTGGTPGSFKGYKNTMNYGGYGNINPDEESETAWEDGFNFADRNCTNKDLYSKSGRVFAQGGYYYVPEGVTAITIEAYWGKAVYLHNTGHYIDRVKMTNQTANGNLKLGEPFKPAGTLDDEFQEQTVYDNWNTAVKNLPEATLSDNKLSRTVYDQAVVLLSNFQIRNENNAVGTDLDEGKFHPYTLMSIDKDFDNEPDYCFEFQFRQQFGRPPIQPIRFDFLPVPELGMAVRHDKNQNTIGIFIPQGHFEITETSYMHTTQFEYDYGTNSSTQKAKVEAPVILNGGHFEQIVVRRGVNQKTSYFIMGGHFKMLRFTPGAHVTPDNTIRTRHCAVNAIGGDYPEFYLSGIYKANQPAYSDNPHCYINGGRFGIIAGAGYEKVDGNVTFKIDHSVIREFYGGGINGTNPISGSIDVTINNSLVYKYCGGPKIGVMTNVNGVFKTVTTNATGTIFTKYYGGGNGGTSHYREGKYDGNTTLPGATPTAWTNSTLSPNPGFKTFNPLNTINGIANSYEGTGDNKGYHALFEFECFVESNGIGGSPTVRTYLHWAQFGTTKTGDVTNTLKGCTIKTDFYGGGNLGNVEGKVTSTLENCTVFGNVYGGGFSGRIEPFRIHEKNIPESSYNSVFPRIDNAGVMQNGLNGTESFPYVKNDNGTERYFTWCYKNTSGQMFPQGVVIPNDASTTTNLKATFEYPEGSNKWYVLTTVSLEGLGAVSNDVELNLIGTTKVGTEGDPNTGNVFGGGNESTVNGSATITISGSAEVLQNVFGGGNQASVGVNTTGTPGNTTVNLQEGAHVHGNVYGGGNEGAVGGNSEVIIKDPENEP